MEGLSEEEVAIVETVRDFVNSAVKPVAQELERDRSHTRPTLRWGAR